MSGLKSVIPGTTLNISQPIIYFPCEMKLQLVCKERMQCYRSVFF